MGSVLVYIDDSPLAVAVLVVAKAPVPGKVKTRLAATVGAELAAEVAAAALLDTLDAVRSAPVHNRIIALDGDLDAALRSVEIRSALNGFTVIPQRGEGLGQRLANAHLDAGTLAGKPVLQIGMDTPQVTPNQLGECARVLLQSDAALGMARDGGWWILGVSTPDLAAGLVDVVMSSADTGRATLEVLRARGCGVALLPLLDDVDTIADVFPVRMECPLISRFRRATAAW
ncbi:DUF2064 domain-containing protein [Mycolicibacterium sp. CH28]|uniref:TIGR04282 family arsenosugar biosynthesis glycosyltransferase n=1 Tax=Mycolicibacterium sp. CH28 TaxID=2512237 RepID=UPI0010810190|nr:DUF2064 domain-containing protein [Mycolicibacterium sp. CH28]TGD84421.1 DUF2064 domain-containing protein [Mycolicibacterium sp. CH28]